MHAFQTLSKPIVAAIEYLSENRQLQISVLWYQGGDPKTISFSLARLRPKDIYHFLYATLHGFWECIGSYCIAVSLYAWLGEGKELNIEKWVSESHHGDHCNHPTIAINAIHALVLHQSIIHGFLLFHGNNKAEHFPLWTLSIQSCWGACLNCLWLLMDR